jgi:hypothetical protein
MTRLTSDHIDWVAVDVYATGGPDPARRGANAFATAYPINRLG